MKIRNMIFMIMKECNKLILYLQNLGEWFTTLATTTALVLIHLLIPILAVLAFLAQFTRVTLRFAQCLSHLVSYSCKNQCLTDCKVFWTRRWPSCIVHPLDSLLRCRAHSYRSTSKCPRPLQPCTCIDCSLSVAWLFQNQLDLWRLQTFSWWSRNKNILWNRHTQR